MSRPPLLLVHAAATLAMACALWFVQLAHYPRLAAIPAPASPEAFRRNIRRTTWLLGPIMAFEMGAAILLALTPDPLARLGLALLVAAWLSTFLVQYPIHRGLALRHDAGQLRRLLRGNWTRTTLWTLRAAVALVLLKSP